MGKKKVYFDVIDFWRDPDADTFARLINSFIGVGVKEVHVIYEEYGETSIFASEYIPKSYLQGKNVSEVEYKVIGERFENPEDESILELFQYEKEFFLNEYHFIAADKDYKPLL